MTKPSHPWSHPITIHDVPESGRHVRLMTDEGTRAAVAAQAEVRELPRLKADFHIRRHGRDGLHVVGRVSATVGQTCVVTLDPIENEVEEEIDVVFTPAASVPGPEGEVSLDIAVEDPPEPLVGGVVDLGAVATEFLMLGIDPYPRKPGAAFDAPPAGDDEGHPFAALAALKKGRDEK